MPLFYTGIVFLVIFVAVGAWQTRYEDELPPISEPLPKANDSQPATIEHDPDFCEWWTPAELEHLAKIEASRNENEAALDGRHI